jgi:flagellar assembly protein FliH
MSTIIKSSESSGGASLPFHFAEIRGTSPGVAVPQAVELVARARAEADAIRQAAREQGTEAAMIEAAQVAREQLDRHWSQAEAAVREAIEQIGVARAHWLAHWEKTAVHVAVAIAERLIRRELREVPEITLDLVRESLELAAGSADVQVRLHPHDYELLRPRLETLSQELHSLATARIVSDPHIGPGGCRVDTRFGTIDQQFASQLARIEQELG